MRGDPAAGGTLVPVLTKLVRRDATGRGAATSSDPARCNSSAGFFSAIQGDARESNFDTSTGRVG